VLKIGEFHADMQPTIELAVSGVILTLQAFRLRPHPHLWQTCCLLVAHAMPVFWRGRLLLFCSTFSPDWLPL
jgi:hypothetical protein